MFAVFSRSWEITKLSIEVIKKDKELLLFPLLAGLFSALFIIAMIFPTIFAAFIAPDGTVAGMGIYYGTVFVVYLGLSFVATFFNVCVVYTTKKRFDGGNATFGESIGFAFSKIHLIFAWSLVSATVGLILRLIDNMAERMGQTGRIIVHIVTAILGAMWSIVTLFVIPAMVYHNLGPIAAIKKSAQTLKKTWGESLIRHYGLGLLELIFLIPAFVIGFFVLLSGTVTNSGVLLVILGILAVYALAVMLFFGVVSSIFNTALYVYADTGKIPGGYTQDVMQNAFGSK